MRIADVKVDAAEKQIWLLVEYGFGGGYQTSRIWECSSIEDALTGDISETHQARATLSDYDARLLDRGTVQVDRQAEYAFAPGSAQSLLRGLATCLGVANDDVHLSALKRKREITVAELCDLLKSAAQRTLQAALQAGK